MAEINLYSFWTNSLRPGCQSLIKVFNWSEGRSPWHDDQIIAKKFELLFDGKGMKMAMITEPDCRLHFKNLT